MDTHHAVLCRGSRDKVGVHSADESEFDCRPDELSRPRPGFSVNMDTHCSTRPGCPNLGAALLPGSGDKVGVHFVVSQILTTGPMNSTDLTQAFSITPVPGFLYQASAH